VRLGGREGEGLTLNAGQIKVGEVSIGIWTGKRRERAMDVMRVCSSTIFSYMRSHRSHTIEKGIGRREEWANTPGVEIHPNDTLVESF
jgi:hypothetical protein